MNPDFGKFKKEKEVISLSGASFRFKGGKQSIYKLHVSGSTQRLSDFAQNFLQAVSLEFCASLTNGKIERKINIRAFKNIYVQLAAEMSRSLGDSQINESNWRAAAENTCQLISQVACQDINHRQFATIVRAGLLFADYSDEFSGKYLTADRPQVLSQINRICLSGLATEQKKEIVGLLMRIGQKEQLLNEIGLLDIRKAPEEIYVEVKKLEVVTKNISLVVNNENYQTVFEAIHNVLQKVPQTIREQRISDLSHFLEVAPEMDRLSLPSCQAVFSYLTNFPEQVKERGVFLSNFLAELPESGVAMLNSVFARQHHSNEPPAVIELIHEHWRDGRPTDSAFYQSIRELFVVDSNSKYPIQKYDVLQQLREPGPLASYLYTCDLTADLEDVIREVRVSALHGRMNSFFDVPLDKLENLSKVAQVLYLTTYLLHPEMSYIPLLLEDITDSLKYLENITDPEELRREELSLIKENVFAIIAKRLPEKSLDPLIAERLAICLHHNVQSSIEAAQSNDQQTYRYMFFRNYLRGQLPVDAQEKLIASLSKQPIEGRFLHAFKTAAYAYSESLMISFLNELGRLESWDESKFKNPVIQQFLLRQIRSSEHLSAVFPVWSTMLHFNEEKFSLIVDFLEYANEEKSSYAIRTILEKWLMVTDLEYSDPLLNEELDTNIQYALSFDVSPFPPGSPDKRRSREESFEIMRGTTDMHYGFPAFTFPCRSLPKGEPAMMERFLKSAAVQLTKINLDTNQFPGNGWVVTGLKPGKIFPLSELHEDPKIAELIYQNDFLPWAKEVFPHLQKTKFYIFRGFIAIQPPENLDTKINGQPSMMIVFNNHFQNLFQRAGYSVPHESFLKTFAKVANGELNLSSPERMLFEVSNGFRDLRVLSWESNYTGSLSNSFLPGSSPYHDWENIRGGHSRDFRGHIHKSHHQGKYETDYQNLSAEMRNLITAHREVFQANNSALLLWDLYRVGFSNYHKGFTLDNVERQQLELSALESESGEDSQEPLQVPESYYRMLDEAFKWHTQLHAITDDQDRFPVLIFKPVMSSSIFEVRDLDFRLDTYDLSVEYEGESFVLDSSKGPRGKTAREFWINKIVAVFFESRGASIDLEFIDRRILEY